MKIILVNGSPNKNGCTYRALKEMEKEILALNCECEIFWIGNKPLSGCLGCSTCLKTGKCVFNDSVNEFLEKSKTADGFVFGSPVHYSAISGALSSFMDRAFYGKGNLFKFKPACGIVSARRSGTTSAVDEINKYFMMNQMPIASSVYWNAVHGKTPQEVEQDAEGLQTMRILARNLVWLVKCIKNSGEELPRQEAPQKTNFIR